MIAHNLTDVGAGGPKDYLQPTGLIKPLRWIGVPSTQICKHGGYKMGRAVRPGASFLAKDWSKVMNGALCLSLRVSLYGKNISAISFGVSCANGQEHH